MMKKVKYRIKKFSDIIALLSVEFFIVFISFFISLALLVILIRQVFYNKEFTMDNRVFNYLSPYISDTNTVIMQFISFFGSHKFLIPAWLFVFIYYFFIRNKKWFSIKLVIIAMCNLGLMFGLKLFFNRPRPLIPLLKDVPGLSFPSGHAFMSFTFFCIIVYLVYRDVTDKWLKWMSIIFLVIVILLIGLSRVYLRVHYASDVIAGFCFGMLSLLILVWMFSIIEKFNAEKIPRNLNITSDGDDVISV
jgi:undecaprenyl-diphosphatase